MWDASTREGFFFYQCDMLALVRRWRKCIASGANNVGNLCFVTEDLLFFDFNEIYNVVINRRHYFRSKLYVYACELCVCLFLYVFVYFSMCVFISLCTAAYSVNVAAIMSSLANISFKCRRVRILLYCTFFFNQIV